jgi:hypothetical protein
MALAEVADRSEVRRIERDNHHEIVPLVAGSSPTFSTGVKK